MTREKIPTLVSLALVLCVVLTGCGAGEDDAPTTGTAPDSASSDQFSGPWGDLFASTFAETTSDVEREALADGVVSSQEYAYFQGQVISCLEDLGITGHFASDKSLMYANPKKIDQDTITGCMTDNGLRIVTLRDAMDRNPDHLDENKIMVECLKRAGAVDQNYSDQDFIAGVDLDHLLESDSFADCNSDPLHLTS